MDKEKETEFNSAYDLYADMLYKIAFLHTADKDESEDILQEVFIKLLYKSPTFKSSEHKKAWLIKTTTNQCKDFLKSSRRKNLPLNDEILGEEIFDDKKLDVRNKLLKSDCKKFTAKTYRNGDKIQDVIYYANGASNALLKNPDLKYEDLPSDTITITVKFKDGQKVTKKIKTSFNSKGQLQLQYVK